MDDLKDHPAPQSESPLQVALTIYDQGIRKKAGHEASLISAAKYYAKESRKGEQKARQTLLAHISARGTNVKAA